MVKRSRCRDRQGGPAAAGQGKLATGQHVGEDDMAGTAPVKITKCGNLMITVRRPPAEPATAFPRAP